ncbi:lipopolysaccharide-induced tumor necrosis factor-alpha factor [Anolis carolinensis]|uniref:lipopolysaccharide-induced tumor necrosis factor-alpha factor n=1 Tax=Anolis carolinensis TaxID=28377 RepID=UPI002F2B8EA1
MEQKTIKHVTIPMTELDPRPEPYVPQCSQTYEPKPYTSQTYETKPYTSQTYEPKSYTSQSYEPKPYTSQTYETKPYTSQTYESQPCGPESYESQPYAPEKYMPDPYMPQSSSGDAYSITNDCYGNCPSPPPYSCQDMPYDSGLGPICMTNNPPVVVAGIFSSKPASTICPCCRQIITTEVTFRVGSLTYALCTAMCLLGCCLGCCFVPFLTKCSKDVDHYCPCCRYHVYRYKRL